MYTMCDCLVLNEYYDRAGLKVHMFILVKLHCIGTIKQLKYGYFGI